MSGSSLGRAGFAPVPPAITSNVQPAPSAEATIDTIRKAIEDLKPRGVEPSVIVMGDGIPDGLTIEDPSSGICFLTISRRQWDGFVATMSEATRFRQNVEIDGEPRLLWGLPVVDLEAVERGGSPRGRTLAAYYRAAILGYAVGAWRGQ